MLLNYEDTMGNTVEETDEIEQIIGIIMAQKYRVKEGLKNFVERGEDTVW